MTPNCNIKCEAQFLYSGRFVGGKTKRQSQGNVCQRNGEEGTFDRIMAGQNHTADFWNDTMKTQLHFHFCKLALIGLGLAGMTTHGRGQDTNAATAAAAAEIAVDVAHTGAPINPHIYGQFIEHLGRSIYGGIWAEMLEDRKFYSAVGETRRDKVYVPSPWKSVGD